MRLSTVPEAPVNLPDVPNLHRDVIAAALPPDTAPRCVWCTGAVWIGAVVVVYPYASRPAFVLHALCEAVARRTDPLWYAAVLDPALWAEESRSARSVS